MGKGKPICKGNLIAHINVMISTRFAKLPKIDMQIVTLCNSSPHPLRFKTCPLVAQIIHLTIQLLSVYKALEWLMDDFEYTFPLEGSFMRSHSIYVWIHKNIMPLNVLFLIVSLSSDICLFVKKRRKRFVSKKVPPLEKLII